MQEAPVNTSCLGAAAPEARGELGSLEGGEGSVALAPPGSNRVHIRKDAGNHPGPNFTGRAGIPSQQKKQPD